MTSFDSTTRLKRRFGQQEVDVVQWKGRVDRTNDGKNYVGRKCTLHNKNGEIEWLYCEASTP
jgi:hypothetical protein